MTFEEIVNTIKLLIQIILRHFFEFVFDTKYILNSVDIQKEHEVQSYITEFEIWRKLPVISIHNYLCMLFIPEFEV